MTRSLRWTEIVPDVEESELKLSFSFRIISKVSMNHKLLSSYSIKEPGSSDYVPG